MRLGGIDQAGLRWLPRRRWFPRSFPVLPSLFYRLHFVPEELMAITFYLHYHPVLPGLFYRSRAPAPENRVSCGRDLPAGGLEPLCALAGSTRPGSDGFHAAAGFPVLPSLFYRLHFVPEGLMAITFYLHYHPVLPRRRACAAKRHQR